MERQTMVAKLKGLREEFEKESISIVDVQVSFAMALSDVCDALGLTQEEQDAVLGQEATEAIAEWKLAKMWIPGERETATVPVERLVAVPVA